MWTSFNANITKICKTGDFLPHRKNLYLILEMHAVWSCFWYWFRRIFCYRNAIHQRPLSHHGYPTTIRVQFPSPSARRPDQLKARVPPVQGPLLRVHGVGYSHSETWQAELPHGHAAESTGGDQRRRSYGYYHRSFCSRGKWSLLSAAVSICGRCFLLTLSHSEWRGRRCWLVWSTLLWTLKIPTQRDFGEFCSF